MDKPSIDKVIETLKPCHVDALCFGDTDLLHFKDQNNHHWIRASLQLNCPQAADGTTSPVEMSSLDVQLSYFEGKLTHTYKGDEALQIIDAVIGFDEFAALLEKELHAAQQEKEKQLAQKADLTESFLSPATA